MKAHRCTQFSSELFDSYDHILCMDAMNEWELKKYTRSKEDIQKIKYLRSFDLNCNAKEIQDPIGGDLSEYEATYHQILDCLGNFIQMNGSFGKTRPVNLSKFRKNGFDTSKKTVLFVCCDSLIVSPLCEAIFNKKVSESKDLSEIFNIASSCST